MATTSRRRQGYSNGCLPTSCHPPLELPLRTHHILISYPFGPRSILTSFHGGTYQRKLEGLVRDPLSRVLIVHGDEDEFTGAASYQTWASALEAIAIGASSVDSRSPQADASGSTLGSCQVRCIPGATHFWRGDALETLLGTIQTFLDSC